MVDNALPPVGATTDVASTAHTLAQLNADLHQCKLCPLHERATQAVPGRGPADATLLVVGEQPGNDEDLAGEPFVGPAGRLLKEALQAAKIPAEKLYITNAVKHFRWVPQGPRRLHQKPGALHVRACSSWLAAEVRLVQPRLILCLGATAGQAVLGPKFRVGQHRGQRLTGPLGPAFATLHPSAILRMPERAMQAEALRAFVADLQAAWALCQASPLPAPSLQAAPPQDAQLALHP